MNDLILVYTVESMSFFFFFFFFSIFILLLLVYFVLRNSLKSMFLFSLYCVNVPFFHLRKVIFIQLKFIVPYVFSCISIASPLKI